MTTWKDIFLRILLFIAFILLSIIVAGIMGSMDIGAPILIASVLVFMLLYRLLIQKLRDKKRAAKFLKNDLASLNYIILSERLLTLTEKFENYDYFSDYLAYGFFPWISYKNIMKRIFVVTNYKDHDFELIISVTQSWRNKFRYRIDNTSRIRD